MEILDAKYAKADLPAIVKDNCKHLTPSEREPLLSLLLKFEQLFDGTLGEWNLPPVDDNDVQSVWNQIEKARGISAQATQKYSRWRIR